MMFNRCHGEGVEMMEAACHARADGSGFRRMMQGPGMHGSVLVLILKTFSIQGGAIIW
jgi:hypothetical protein